MPQPLTLEHFDETITAFKAHVDERFDAVAVTLAEHGAILADHTARLERLEKLLDLEQRFDRLQADTRERFRKVGEHLGMADVAAG